MRKVTMTVLLIVASLLLSGHSSLAGIHKPTKNIRVAILDSGFCPGLLQNAKGIQVNPAWFAVKTAFDLKCRADALNSRRFHGHKVLQLLLDDWSLIQRSAVTLSIDPIIMLDEAGYQSLETWKRALTKIDEEKYDIVLSSVGFAFRSTSEFEKSKLSLPHGPVYFFAAGEKTGKLANAELFPQITAVYQKPVENKKIHLIGLHYFDGKNWIQQARTFYLDSVTDWTTDDPRPEFMGTSFAVPRTLIRWLRSEYF